MGQLDLDTTKKPVRRQAEYSIGGRFDQFDQPGRKLPANLVALLETCHGAAIGGTIAPETLIPMTLPKAKARQRFNGDMFIMKDSPES